MIYTVFRWALTLNMPHANTFVQLTVAHSIVFKEVVNEAELRSELMRFLPHH